MEHLRLVVLMYHAVVEAPLAVPDWCFMSKRDFETQMEFIGRLGSAVALEQAIKGGRAADPRSAIAVTFDDGFRNNLEFALPALQRFQIPATVFLPTAFLDSNRCLWFCRVNRAIAATDIGSLEWHGQTYDLSSQSARAATSATIQSRLKEYPQPRLLEELNQLCAQLGEECDWPLDETSPYATLSSEEIRSLYSTGLVDFGAHSETHAILSLMEREAKAREICGSIKKVATLRGGRCSLFAYPNGRRQDFDSECMALLRQQGIDCALTAEQGVNDERTPKLELRRIGVGAGTTLAEFEATLRACGCV
jgi:peptidoglycan/xylan/chitin deacetylase (PgdA/CDA1 family)